MKKKKKREQEKKKKKEKKKRKKKKLERPNPDFRVHQSPRGPGARAFFFLYNYYLCPLRNPLTRSTSLISV